MHTIYDRVATEARWDREDNGPAADDIHPAEYAGHVDPIAPLVRAAQAAALVAHPPVHAGHSPWCAGEGDPAGCCTSVSVAL